MPQRATALQWQQREAQAQAQAHFTGAQFTSISTAAAIGVTAHAGNSEINQGPAH